MQQVDTEGVRCKLPDHCRRPAFRQAHTLKYHKKSHRPGQTQNVIVGHRHVHVICQRRHFSGCQSHCCRQSEDCQTHACIEKQRIPSPFQRRNPVQPHISRDHKQAQKPAVIVAVTIRGKCYRHHRLPEGEIAYQHNDNDLQRPFLQLLYPRRQKRRKHIHKQIRGGEPVMLRLDRQHIVQPVIYRQRTCRHHAGTTQYHRDQERIKKNLPRQRHHPLRFPCRLYQKITAQQHIAVDRHDTKRLCQMRRIVYACTV